MWKISGVYAIKNKLTDDLYIGSSDDIKRRWVQHRRELKAGRHYNKILQSAWDKYGEENMLFEIIEACDKSELLKREQEYIDDCQPRYNIMDIAYCPPSRKGTSPSKETREKISRALRGRKFSEEVRRRNSEGHVKLWQDEEYKASRSGKNHPNHGTSMSEEQKEKISATLMGHPVSEEVREKMSNAKKGKAPWNKGLSRQ